MDSKKVGRLIFSLRKEKNMTQKDIANALRITVQTVSKWERGIGCPDVSLLGDLANLLGVSIEKILAGDLNENVDNGGNMRKIKFYTCQNCGNIIYSTGDGEISCCGRKLENLVAKSVDNEHQITINEMDSQYFVTLQHEMSKTHYISFISYVTYDRVLLIKMYPEQNPEVRLPRMSRGKLYVYCNVDGLFVRDIK
ncbi:helix-turn-helix domain-containing protein [Fredinandcohnia sp. 179-A 10B2 NHS]|uniref:helix-turn-helix domain-containing protein n=1 Tax=Fredinandcohnia sp. 179-A 10B2 NHS TaxID=3235176 RepID=UPI0039A16D59